MRNELIEKAKGEIQARLSDYLRDEGIALYIAANDNIGETTTAVILEKIEGIPLLSGKLITEIRVIMSVLGKPSHMDALIDGIYRCLHPHALTLTELTVVLMSLHVETIRRSYARPGMRRAIMRYIVEEESMGALEITETLLEDEALT